MSFRIFRASALAPVAILLVTLLGAETSGAWAQNQGSESALVENDEPLPAGAPRFVAQEVVQPLPVEDAFSDEALLEERVHQATSLHELVGDMPVEVPLSPEMKCLAQAVYFEARGEPLVGQLAVARVVINRAASRHYPDDYCSVVVQRSQFSFVRNGRIPAADQTSRAWLRAKAIAQIAHQDLWDSEAGDAIFFHATYVRPSWARQKTPLARIDTHVFYR
jgi:spore germination cell wall hydrolase CwlJ-like protein